MKKLLLIIALAFAGIGTINAQSKKSNEQVSNINTNGSWFEFIYQGESKDKTAVRIKVIDNSRQYVAMNFARMRDQSKDSDPLNYYVKLIHVPDFGSLAFKQAESMEENSLPEDGINVLVVRFKDLQEAALIWYQ